jgi:hypothetical protein
MDSTNWRGEKKKSKAQYSSLVFIRDGDFSFLSCTPNGMGPCRGTMFDCLRVFSQLLQYSKADVEPVADARPVGMVYSDEEGECMRFTEI